MSANTWYDTGADSADDFDIEGGGEISLARIGNRGFYIEVPDRNGKSHVVVVESKEIMRMAHWIIKEFS